MVSIGVVGVGSLGFHHARILNSLDGVRLAGVFDARAERAAEVANGFNATAHASLESLLDQCDAIVVAVPTIGHEDVAIAALARGIDVLIEKPMAPDLAAADRILDAAKATDAMVQVGHIERFNAAVRAAEKYLEQPLFVESHRLAPFTARSTDVAVILDLMIHDVDLVGSLVGRPVVDIAAAGVAVLTRSPDIANARLTFEGGAVANLTASRVSIERVRKIRIFQSSGYLSLNLAEGTGEFLRLKREMLDLVTSGGIGSPVDALGGRGLADVVERIQLQGDGVEPLRRELESFRDASIGLHPPLVSGEAGRAALAVSLSIEERIRAVRT